MVLAKAIGKIVIAKDGNNLQPLREMVKYPKIQPHCERIAAQNTLCLNGTCSVKTKVQNSNCVGRKKTRMNTYVTGIYKRDTGRIHQK